jgi:hypothetical protein
LEPGGKKITNMGAQVWIYVFRDTGYDIGVKVGRSSSRFGAWDDAPSYSPRQMQYVAGWRVDLPEQPGVSKGAAASQVERSVAAQLGPNLVYPRNGREWFRLSAADAIERISSALRSEPSLRDGHTQKNVTNDQFRNPGPHRIAEHRFKLVAWVYREHLTGRIKTQVNDDWTNPFETRRRYSRNGFEEIAAFSYPGPVSSAGNIQTHEVWRKVMKALGPGPEDRFYGWLSDGVVPSDAARIYGEALRSLPLEKGNCPPGVRKRYNVSQ